MAAKTIKYGDDAWRSIGKGIDTVAEAVRVTLGPLGRNVLIEKKWGSPLVTKDGVTVAKEIELEDKFENMGAQLLKEVSAKTNDVAGDGTTTATILGHAIFKAGIKNVVAGANPMELKRGIDKAVEIVVTGIRAIAKTVETREAIAQVASISANNDTEIGELIADAMEKVGKNGVITVEESKGIQTELEVVEGMQFDKGYSSPYMVTDKESMQAEFDNPYILLTDRKISSIKDILPLLEKIVQAGRSLVIIAENIEGEALATLVVNKLRGTFNCLAIKAPGFGDRRKEILEDIAILTGGEVISEEKGLNLENTELSQLGTASKVKADKDNTTIVQGKGSADSIKARIKEIENLRDKTDSSYDREKLQERLAKLSGGVALIKVGAATETELKEKKHRVEDALSATRAAIEEGIVPGGGTAFINQIKALEAAIEKESGDFRVGMLAIKEALGEPARQIANNAGREGSVIVAETKTQKPGVGYDARTNQFVDMVAAGIVDPAKVVISAITNGASIAGTVITTKAAIIEEEDESSAAGMGGGMGGGMPGMM